MEIQTIFEGGQELTEGEIRVLKLLMKGFNRERIAESLNISLNTVKTHLENAYEKLGVHSAVEAVVKLREGTISFPDEGDSE
jgi:DNA-binding NarL/FixJ family response regulator